MKFEVENSLAVKWIASISAACTVVFLAFLFLDERHLHDHDKVEVTTKMDKNDSLVRQRILMSESTRYAEIAKYYYELKAERPLTLAELNRLRLVEAQQRRIEETLLGTTEQ